jgi:hypothetical protein
MTVSSDLAYIHSFTAIDWLMYNTQSPHSRNPIGVPIGITVIEKRNHAAL